MFDDLKGKRILVSGAGTGIGSGIALGFAKAGAEVVVHYSSSSAGADKVVADIRQMGGRAVAIQANFSEVEPIRDLAREAIAFLGGIDAVVNNAGITMNRPFEKVTAEQFDILYNVNVRAPFFLIQTLLPELEKSRGTVINISSIHAFEGYTEHSVYAGTRGAIVSFTRQLAIELAPRGVRVNAIAPGGVPVPNYFKHTPDVDIEKTIKGFGKNIPCGFAGTPEDIANVALFLASEASRYIVAQTLVVDGGTTSWMPFGEQFKQPLTIQFGKDYVPGL